jgi:AcrR family transcriptional regulator
VKRGRGRPRRAGADEEILTVALELLREKGYRDLSVDEIADRTGIAKTTVYRRWPTKGALVAAAITLLVPQVEDDLESALRDTTSLLELIAGVDDVEVLRAVIAPQRRWIRTFVESDEKADMLLGQRVVNMLLS